MRYHVAALAGACSMLLAVSAAVAADMDQAVLRGDVQDASGQDGNGSPWDATYAGVSGGYAIANFKIGSANSGLASDGSSFNGGIYAGQTSSWDGVVFGWEGAYQRGFLQGKAGNGVSIGKDSITDIVMAKGRIGYDAGAYMPFLAAGIVGARGTAARGVGATYQSISRNEIGFGLTGGFGIDYMMTPNMIMRAEYEISTLSGFGGSTIGIQNFKLGLASKF